MIMRNKLEQYEDMHLIEKHILQTFMFMIEKLNGYQISKFEDEIKDSVKRIYFDRKDFNDEVEDLEYFIIDLKSGATRYL